jgi:hypothetical protein
MHPLGASLDTLTNRRETMLVTIKQNPFLALFLRHAFPSYRKHKAIICAGSSVRLSGAYWDGGTRSTYFATTLAGTEVDISYSTAPAQFGGTEKEIILTPGVVVLQAGTFCGKPATVTLHALPETLATLGIQ